MSDAREIDFGWVPTEPEMPTNNAFTDAPYAGSSLEYPKELYTQGYSEMLYSLAPARGGSEIPGSDNMSVSPWADASSGQEVYPDAAPSGLQVSAWGAGGRSQIEPKV